MIAKNYFQMLLEHNKCTCRMFLSSYIYIPEIHKWKIEKNTKNGPTYLIISYN